MNKTCSQKINVAVLVSGGGTNLQALIDFEKSGKLKNGKIVKVISSKEGAFAGRAGFYSVLSA
jgi:folate-dependent phosphoribosylglycinamide formyltransferase PurN